MKTYSLILLAAILLVVIKLHLVPAAFVGMLLFLLTRRLGNQLNQYFARHHWHEHACRSVAAGLMVVMVVGIITALTMFLSRALGNEENIAGLAAKVGDILNDMRDKLPPVLLPYLPDSLMELRQTLVALIKQHGNELSRVGKDSVHALVHILIAIAIGVILSLQSFVPMQQAKPFARAMRERCNLLSLAFGNVVFAQVKISAINTLLTGVFLLVALPLSGIHLPYAKTLVLITFVLGLLPIVGNLMSNALIFVVALGLSFHVAMLALLFLIAIHKLEYFINAKIVGDRIHAAAWELLLAMLLMESAFGIAGLLMAPIIYAYIKAELIQADLV